MNALVNDVKRQLQFVIMWWLQKTLNYKYIINNYYLCCIQSSSYRDYSSVENLTFYCTSRYPSIQHRISLFFILYFEISICFFFPADDIPLQKNHGLFEYLLRRNIIALCEWKGRSSLLAARCVYLTEGRMDKLRDASNETDTIHKNLDERDDDDRYTHSARYPSRVRHGRRWTSCSPN